MFNPLVSVVIVTFNRPKEVLRTLTSVLNQTYIHKEIILVDNNIPNSETYKSTYERILPYLEKKNIIYIKNNINSNASTARNIGLKKAKGYYINFLDDDDEMNKNYIHSMVLYLQNNKNFSAVYCKLNFLKHNRVFYKSRYSNFGTPLYDIFMSTHEFQTSNVLLKKKDVLTINGFDESFNRSQDLEFFIRFLQLFSIGHLNKHLINIHIDDNKYRPNVTNLIETKKFFFNKMNKFFNKFNSKEQRLIKQSHNYHLLRTAIKSFDVRSFYYIFKINPIYFIKLNIIQIRKYFLSRFRNE